MRAVRGGGGRRVVEGEHGAMATWAKEMASDTTHDLNVERGWILDEIYQGGV